MNYLDLMDNFLTLYQENSITKIDSFLKKNFIGTYLNIDVKKITFFNLP